MVADPKQGLFLSPIGGKSAVGPRLLSVARPGTGASRSGTGDHAGISVVRVAIVAPGRSHRSILAGALVAARSPRPDGAWNLDRVADHVHRDGRYRQCFQFYAGTKPGREVPLRRGRRSEGEAHRCFQRHRGREVSRGSTGTPGGTRCRGCLPHHRADNHHWVQYISFRVGDGRVPHRGRGLVPGRSGRRQIDRRAGRAALERAGAA